MNKYYVEFNVKTGYYVRAESEEQAIDKAYTWYEDYEPDVFVLKPTEEELENEIFN